MSKVNAFAPALLILLLGWIGPLPARAADDTKATLDRLLKVYRELELPLPPKDALLIRYETGRALVDGEFRYTIGFQLEPGTRTLSPKVLQGTEEFQTRRDIHAKAIAPQPDSLKKLDCGFHDWLITAIQCHYMGWTPLAESIVTRCHGEGLISPDTALIRQAWSYWESQLRSPTSDLAKAFKNLKKLIKSDKLDDEYNQKLLKSLELALAPSKAKPGSIEALIDDLVDNHANFDGVKLFEHGLRYQRLAERGFEAVPALIEHLDDERLTRSVMGLRACGPLNLRVQDIVSYLIKGLAGEGSSQDWQWHEGSLHTLEKPEVKKWWDRAKKMGEEQYAVDRVLPTKNGDEDGDINDHLLHVIALKYPMHLPKLYKTVLDEHPSIPGFELADAISKSKLSKDEKMALFLDAVGRSNREHRYVAILQIKSLDKEWYTKLLLEALENLPKVIDQGKYGPCPEARYAKLASESSDPLVWKALEKATKRACVGLRTELLQCAAYPHRDRSPIEFLQFPEYGQVDDEISNEQRKRLLTFLATFLGDNTVRDTSSDTKKYRAYLSVAYDPPLAVQDIAAMEMAPYLNIEIKIDYNRTREEWAKVREQVRQDWKREQERELNSDSGKGKER